MAHRTVTCQDSISRLQHICDHPPFQTNQQGRRETRISGNLPTNRLRSYVENQGGADQPAARIASSMISTTTEGAVTLGV